ncbi:MAG TPA: PD-(D/E)XK nuclease family protein [Solirubrobacteraceae bacterium]|jgi:ATP-dependent helicase/DNAse subunit B|nr:PD-(D/E)XK nuclease family protein [Solirubrobacteraceae bacterium]
MPLRLITGPANSGKAGVVLEAVRAAVTAGRDPLLVVPTLEDVEHYRRELADTSVMGVRVERFAGLIEQIARRAGVAGRPLGEVARERLAAAALGPALPGAAPALARLAAELQIARVTPERLRRAGAGQAADAYGAYLGALRRARAVDAEGYAARALDALRREPRRWGGTPVLLYGFDDFTALELDAVETLARVVDAPVTLSLSFEAGRHAFAGRAGALAELAPLAAEHVTLPPRPEHYRSPVLHHLERSLFEEDPTPMGAGDAVRLLQGGGERAEYELVAGEIAELLERGLAPEDIAVVARSLTSIAPLLAQVLEEYQVPVALPRHPIALAHTGVGRGLVSLLRAAGPGGRADELLAWLRSPGMVEQAGLVDRLEHELRRRGEVSAVAARALWESYAWPLDALDRVAQAAQLGPAALIERADRELRSLFAAPRRGRAALLAGADALEARAFAAAGQALEQLAELARADPAPLAGEGAVLGALERLEVQAGERSREGAVSVLEPLGLRARRVRVLLLVGLQDGAFPAPASGEPFLSDVERTRLAREGGLRLARREPGLAAERYLLYATISRARERLVLSWHDADDDGAPQVRSPFLDDIAALLDGGLPVRTRALGAVDWSGGARPTPAAERRAAAATGPRRAGRQLGPLCAPAVLEGLRARPAWSASALEQYAGCPMRWLVERQLRAGDLDPDPEPLARGGLAHAVLEATLRRLGTGLQDANLSAALALMREELAARAAERPVSPRPERAAAATRRLQSDLERLLTRAAATTSRFSPAHLELGFGFEDEPDPTPALDLGEGLRIRGRVDRIDVDPRRGEAIVIDYKATKAPDGGKWLSERSYQLAVYMRVASDLLGLRTVAGLYQPVSVRDQRPRGAALADVVDGLLPGDEREDRAALDALVEETIDALRAAWREASAGWIEARPDTCLPAGRCALPAICRSER